MPSPADLERGRMWLLLTSRSGMDLSTMRMIFDEQCKLLEDHRADAGGADARLTKSLEDLERDVSRTFSSGVADEANCVKKLRRVLSALAVWDRATGYVQGINFIAAFALLHTESEVEAWAITYRLLHHPDYALRTLYTDGMRHLCASSEVLAALLRTHAPAVSAHLDRVGVDVFLTHDWYLVLFTTTLPSAMAARVWDTLAADGSVVLMRAMVLLLAHLQPYLLCAEGGADQHATLMLLRGYARARASNGEGLGGPEVGGGVAAPTAAIGADGVVVSIYGGEIAIEPPADLVEQLRGPVARLITPSVIANLTRQAEIAARRG